MPRVGLNPRKFFERDHSHERVTVAITVHVPFLGGYWEQSLDVLKVCIGSLVENTRVPFDLMVFDNRSCVEVQEYLVELRQQEVIQYLILSDTNVRQVGAWNVMFPAAPGEIVAYSDSDALFLPGWLASSLRVLETFPRAGAVSAQPARGQPYFEEGCSLVVPSAEQDSSIRIRRGELIPRKYLEAHRLGLGATIEEHRRLIGEEEDVLLSQNGVGAYVTSSDFQFLITKDAVQEVFPMSGDAVSRMNLVLNEAGFWRLSTVDYLVHHMGNALLSAQNGYDGLGEWLPEDGFLLSVAAPGRSSTRSVENPVLRYLLGRSRVKGFLKRLNVLTYRILSDAA